MMRAQFGAFTVGALMLVACASTGSPETYVHPKARKTHAPPVWVAAPEPVPTAVPFLPPVAIPPQPPAQLPTIAAPPQTSPPTPTALPSELPVRAPRRDKPSWTVPTPPKALPPIRVIPAPVQVPVVVPAIPPMRVLTPMTMSAPPARATTLPPSPSRSPTWEPVAQVGQPPRPSANASASPLIIARAVGSLEARLPCHRGGSPHCDLRIYQINVGTFVDGSPDHNPTSGYGPGPHTGDIEGVIGALAHIKALGFNTIWLTPIFDTHAGQPQSRAFGPPQVNEKLDGTGYFPRDYFKIDPQFGTLEDAQRLVDQAHGLGLKVMFDGVFGHHKGELTPSPTGARPGDATNPTAYGSTPQTYPGRIVDYGDARSTTFYKEVARYWIDTLGIDGWRLDQVYQIPNGPLREINAEITKASNAQLLSGYVVGEMWGTAAQIRNVLGPSNLPALASAFDFPTRYALLQTLATDENGGTNKPASTINEAWALGAHASYPDHAIMNFMLGNHDLVRFGDLIQRAGKGGPASANYWAIHKMAFTFMAAWSGPITLYYGEEIGAEVPEFAAKVAGNCAAINQCDDHVARNMVALPGVNTPANASGAAARNLKNYLTSVMTLRAANPALYSGSRTHIFSDQDLYIDLKSDGENRFLMVMNTGTVPRQLTLKPSGLGLARLTAATVTAGEVSSGVSSAGLTLTLPPLRAAILKLEGR